MTNINSAFYNYDETVEKSKTSYSGLLGLAINDNRIVNHPTRAGYVYVRLRDNLSEVVQAFNDKVSPVYDFPVLIQRKGNRWYVLGRDDLRYETWGTSAPYLPRHGDQHSFNRDGGGGGDVTWVYPDQFMPLLVYPSGTYGASNLLVAPYVLQKSDKFIYVGNTGTANIARYKPTTSSAIMGLVYLDRDTGNPGFLINSGTPFSGNITGTNAVMPYIPYPSATQEPLYAFRLVSGTSSLTWSNLYNVRQFIGGSTSTGTSTSNHEALSGLLGGSANNHYHLTPSQVIGLVSGTSTTLHQHSGISPAGSTNAVQVNNGGVFGADDEFEYTLGGQIVSLGKDAGAEASAVWSWQTGGVAFHNLASWSTGTYSSMRGIMARGTKASPTAAQADDIGMRFRGSAYDGVGLVLSSATGAEIRFVTNENQSATNHGMRAEIWTTPNGSATETKAFTINADGTVNVEFGKTYNINGSPHTHGREVLVAARSYYVRTDGNDSNTGLVNSAGGAFLTLNAAVAAALALDTAGYAVTVYVGAGTYTGGLSITRPMFGGGTLTFEGDTTTPSNVVISTTSTSAILADGLGTKLIIKGFKVQTTTGGNGVIAQNQATIELYSNFEFGACAGGSAQVFAYLGGRIAFEYAMPYKISGAAGFNLIASGVGSYIQTQGSTVTITGSPVITVFAEADYLSNIISTANTYSGAVSATTNRYSVTGNGIIVTFGGANYFPGTAAGATATGGQYI